MTSVNELSGINYGYRPNTENTYTLHTRPISPQLKVVIDDLMRLQSGNVLNLGCGDGILERFLPVDRKFNLVSVDRDPYAISTLQTILESQKRDIHDTALVDDITQLHSLASDNRQFERAVSWRVLHGIDPQYYRPLLQKVRDKLVRGGTFHFSAASEEDWKAEKLKALHTFNAKGMNNCKEIMFDDHGINREDDFYIHFITLEEMKELAEETQFKITSHNYFQEPSGYNHLRQHQNSYIYIQLEAL